MSHVSLTDDGSWRWWHGASDANLTLLSAADDHLWLLRLILGSDLALSPGSWRPAGWAGETLLYRDEKISIVLTPFDQCNPDARVALVGLTPGRHQLHLALTTVAAALRDGQSIDHAITRAKTRAAFAGPTRANLIRMLDGIGLHDALTVPSTASLFGDRTDLVTTTSAICHAVFVRTGKNYGGTPPVARHPLMAAFARQVLAANLAMTPNALIIPLGDAASDATRLAGADPGRVLYGFPHPSPGNGHRERKYAHARGQLNHQILHWTM